MESSPFIPSPPSATSSNDLYFFPQTCTDTMSQPPELDLRAIYRSQQSHPYPRPVLMSSSGSINLSNVSPAESSAPLPIPRPATPAPPAMSPRTIQSTLATNNDIDAALLRTIANGLLTMMANGETDTAMQFHHFTEQIKGLQDRILKYEDTFEWAPEGYILNDSRIPHFRIPCGQGLSRPAKWIKLNDNGTASAKINISYSILFNLTTSYSSYFGGKKGISRNKTSFFLLMRRKKRWPIAWKSQNRIFSQSNQIGLD